MNQTLLDIASWFKERYKIMKIHPTLKRLYKKYGCTLLVGNKKIDVEGDDTYLNEKPAVIISTHYCLSDYVIIQALTDNHIFWIGDLYFYLAKNKFLRKIPLINKIGIRIHSIYPFRFFYNHLGVIEINRKKPKKYLRKLLKNSISVLERNELLGLFPHGRAGLEEELNIKFDDVGNSGFVDIILIAQKKMEIKIPIITIGVREEEERFVVKFGDKFYLPDNVNETKEEYVNQMLRYIEVLANKTYFFKNLSY